jgi:hypothetical protein
MPYESLLLMPTLRPWKMLTTDQREYVVIYIVAILWCVSYLIFFPLTTALLVDRTVFILWILPVIVGSVLAILGTVSGDNLILERLGVTLVMIGPAMYGLFQIGLTVFFLMTAPEGVDLTARIPLVILLVWLFLLLNRRHRQLGTLVREAKNTPLASEEK